MPPGGGGRVGEDGCTDPPTTGRRGRKRGAPSHSPPPSSCPETLSSENKLEDEQQQEDQHQPAADLPEGALVEILSRVPYRSLCRFKCVSKPWLALCSALDIRKRCPQTLSGFFNIGCGTLKFHNLFGPMVDPALPFLRDSYNLGIKVQLCSSSLLLCKCWKSTSQGDKCDFVVCNPATEKWTVLPPTVLLDQVDVPLLRLDQVDNYIFLGFDTATPSSFVVFAIIGTYCNGSTKVAIYSSETGQWTSVQSGWDNNNARLFGNHEYAFVNGILHLVTDHYSVATLDSEGKVWREIEIPRLTPNINDAGFSIGQSQGRLHAWMIDYDHDFELYVWALEDYDNGKWSLKHTVGASELFRRHGCTVVKCIEMFAIHPECNLIFLNNRRDTTLSYGMDSQNVHVICTSGDFLFGVPYTPCFAEWRSDGH